MATARGIRRVTFSVLLPALALCVCGSQLAAAPPSLDELRTTVQKQFNSTRSLYVAYEETRPDSQGGGKSRHVWAQQGTKTLFRTECRDGVVGLWMSFDGKTTYHLGYDEDCQPAQMELRSDPPDIGLACKFPKLIGLYIGQGGASLPDVVAGDVEFGESADGNIIPLRVRNFVSQPNPTELDLTIELDLVHDDLPRRISFSDVKNPDWKFAYVVDEFEKVKDGVDGKQRWFPKKARYIQETPKRGIEEFLIAVSEVKLNDGLPGGTFVPKVPDGTPVLETTPSGIKTYRYESPPPLTLDELRAAVAEQFSSIRSLQVTHSFTRPASAGGTTDNNVWAHQDSKVLFRTDYTDDSVGFWLSYDGKRSYNLGYDDNRKPVQLDLKDSPPNLGLTCYFSKLLGWHIGQGESSLPEALAGNVEFKGMGDDGVYTVAISNFASNPNPTRLNLIFQVDANHDYLPRRVDFSDVDNPSWKFAYVVEEFGLVKDASTQVERWFPMKGKYIQETPQRGVEAFPITVTDVRLNESLPDSVFVPELPDGMSVIDNTEQGRGRFYIVGGYHSTDEHIARLTADALNQTGRNRFWMIWVWVINIVIGVVVVAAVLFRRKRRGTA